MRKLLAELGVVPSDGFEEFLRNVRIRHYAEHPSTAPEVPVSADTLLASAVESDERVRDVLTKSGLSPSIWPPLLSAGDLNEDRLAAEFEVEAGVRRALDAYRQEYGSRPLDLPGLAVVLLPAVMIDDTWDLRKKGLNVDSAVAALMELIGPSTRPDKRVPIEQIEALDLSETTRRVVRAARVVSAEYQAPLTSSVLVIGVITASRDDTSSVGTIGRAIEGTTRREELGKRIDEWMVWYRAVASQPLQKGYVTATAADVFRRALQFAQHTTGLRVAHGRHFLAALLTVPEGAAGVVDVLRWMGSDPASLRQQLFDDVQQMVRRSALVDDLDIWREFLLGQGRREGPAFTFATVNIEDTQGTDLLDFERDAKSFAALLASNSFTPPLSVGLFGNWGSGKSFFMEQLQKEIAALASDAASAGFETSFCTRIVQIRFNAWHYVEGNLWASLVEHIFRNLRLSADESDEIVNDRRTFYLSQFDHAVAQEVAAKTAIDSAEKQVAVLTTRIADETRAAETAGTLLTQTAQLALPALVRLDDEQKAEVQGAVKELGLHHLAAAANDAIGGAEELRKSGSRLRQTWTWLFHGPGALTRVLLFGAALVGGAIVAGALWLLVRMHAASYIGAAATILASLALWAGKIAKEVKPVLAKIQNARDIVDTAWQKAQQDRDSRLATLKEQERKAHEAADQARTAFAAAEQQRCEAEKALAQLGSDRKLARFIDERIASDDYRKYLGVLALVRSDFETLSRLMSDAAVIAADPRHRIERIVLYIDDLDRCPPRYVRDVLQAVHLLLAFRLFVVVVGVDARWVSRSLEREYRDQLRPEKPSRVTRGVAGYGASAYDYLEKIFQVPFWIEPLTEAATRKLLSGIVKVREPQSEQSVSDATTPSTPAITAAPSPASLPSAVASAPADTPLEVPKAPAAGDHRLKPAALVLDPMELRSMHDLAPLIGRTPRAVKRFANIYRIIRAGKTAAELATFLGQGNRRSTYEDVLLLLAIVTGVPAVSTELFEQLRSAAADESLSTFAERIKSLPPSRDPGAVVEWGQACDAIAAFDARMATVAGDLQSHLSTVSRYSFREPVG